MRSRTTEIATALALSVLLAAAAYAQSPFIKVYFDPAYQVEFADCPGTPVVGDLYVAAVGFNCFVSGAEFAVQYPPAIMWIGDFDVPPVTLGQTPTGISMGFPSPQNGSSPVALCRVAVFWICTHCVPPYTWNPIAVVKHPATGFLGVTNFPNYEMVWGVPTVSWICPISPASETTWGRVKALYGN